MVVSLDVLDAARAGDHGVNLDQASLQDVRSPGDEDVCVLGHNQGTPRKVIEKYALLSGLTSKVPRPKKDIEALIKLTQSDLLAVRVF